MFASSSRRQGSTAARSLFLSNVGQQQRHLYTPIYVPRLQRLKRGDPKEKQYVQKLFEMKEEQKRGIVWRLASGVVCQREPIILPEKPKWEQEFIDRMFERRRLICQDEEKNLEMMQEWKLGTKKATRKEKKQQKKEQYKEKLAKSEGGEEEETSTKGEEEEEQPKIKEKGPVEQKRLTFEEMKALIDELSPRVTEADKLDNRKSLERKLSEKLYLIVKKNRAEHSWQFPQGSRDQGETMRNCAEREFTEECGKSLKVYFEDNAPAAMLQYVHTDEVKKSTGYHGTKVFFYVASYLDGQVTLNTDELQDYLWVSRDELAEYLDPSLHSVAMKFLLPDFYTFQME